MMSKFIYTDVGGTIPAVWGDSVARINDQSPNGRHAVQANAALRPMLGRAPVGGRRNLLTHTEAFDNAVWGITNLDLSFVGGVWRMEATGGSERKHLRHLNPIASDQPFLWSVELKADTAHRARVSVRPTGTFPFIDVDLAAGVITEEDLLTGPGPIPDGTANIEPVGDGWHRVTMFAPAGRSSSAPAPGIAVLNAAGVLSYAANGEAILVRRPQFEDYRAEGPTQYQRVGSALNITEAGVPSPAFIRPDLSDDVLPTVFPDGFTGDVLVCGRKGSWIERDVTIAAGGTLNIGPTTITGGPAGLLAALGDIVGYLPVGKTISTTELSRLMAYFKARGAGSLLDAGDL